MVIKCLRWQETYHDAPAPCKEYLKFYISSDGSHTHTLPQEGGKIKVRTNEMKMKWKEMKMRW